MTTNPLELVFLLLTGTRDSGKINCWAKLCPNNRKPRERHVPGFLHFWRVMSEATLRQKFHSAKHNAANRGIEWKLTFEEFRDWWGDDISKRGQGPDDLQMCRIWDRGAYELGNIYKATTRENQRTAGNTARNRWSAIRAAQHQKAIDALTVVSDDYEEIDWENESISAYFERKGTKQRALYG